MSRVGKEKINLKGLKKYTIENKHFVVEGNLGTNKVLIPDFLKLNINEETKVMTIEVSKENKITHHIAMNGTIVRLVKNAITGVTTGFSKTFLFKGLGYKYVLNGKDLTMQLGYSHPVYSKIPDNITPTAEKPERLKLTSISKEFLGLYAHKLKTFRKWNPYSGKGIIEEGDTPKKKEVVKAKK
jgi:large subunit ribosomal protein L6